jgi:leucyl-tRNA synthetase
MTQPNNQPRHAPPPSPPPSPSDDQPPHRYAAALADQIESRWQSRWAAQGTFTTPNPGDPGFDGKKPKFFCLDMFPYPSGAGLHVGHPEGYTATDIISRYKRMKGFNVLHPMGWDAFGLPAEQYAIQTGIHPSITTRAAIETFRRQLQRFGFSYDWSREFATIDEDYYRWTQWIFLQLYDAWYDTAAEGGRGKARPIAELVGELERGLYGISPMGDLVPMKGRSGGASGLGAAIAGEPVGVRMWHELMQVERRAFIDDHRLAYLDEQTVNWCPKLGTVLANEEVIDGKSERGGYPVYRRTLRQWMFRITAYAQRLLDDLAGLDWPESTRTMQVEWIGRSEGAEVNFPLVVHGTPEYLTIYTTRPDTIFGATYMVIAPEHPLVDRILADPRHANLAEIGAYVSAARNRSDIDRMAEGKDKTGVFSGLHATNPATRERIPIWIADYVLMGVGHGAIMAVPAHDERDFEFASKFGLPIRDVVYPRIVAAMQYFTKQAGHRLPDAWTTVLADMLGLITSNNTPPDRFEEILEIVTGRRKSGEVLAADPNPRIAREEQEREVPERRGVTRLAWLDFIEEQGFTTFDVMRDRFEAGRFHAEEEAPFTGPGYAANSSNGEVSLDGLSTEDARTRIMEWLERTGIGRRKTNFKLRDWLFSRQRYWGEPFPIVYDEHGNHYPIADSALPVKLPEMKEYKPPESDDPAPMLAAATEWLHPTARDAGVSPDVLPPLTKVRREANTMPNWAGSCWYYLRFCDPKNIKAFVGSEAEKYWMGGNGVDLYIGGSEHAVLHLLYARFWHKVLFDLGHVSTAEPMKKLFHQGLITSFSYQRPDKTLCPNDQADEVSEGNYIERGTGVKLTPVIAKMSKTLKNVINPDDVIAEFGADTMRLYEMYMGPLDASKPWNPRDITGCYRFLQRAWRLIISEQTGETVLSPAPDESVERNLHRLIAKVGPDIERLAFNTAIAAMMEFVKNASAGEGKPALTQLQAERFALVMAPFVPHIAEELWQRLGHASSLAHEPWPTHDPAMLVDSHVEIPIQIMGKVRGHITMPAGSDSKAIEAAALAEPRIKTFMEGKTVKKVIVVPGKMVNIVAG